MVFFMASNKHNKSAKLLISTSTRSSKPLKKHPHSILTPFAPAAKKAKPRAAPQLPIYVSTPPCLIISLFMPSPPVSAQPLVNTDTENNDKEKEEVEDNNAKEQLLPPVVRFMSV